MTKNMSLKDLSLQALFVIHGTAILANADGRIDDLVNAELISSDAAEAIRDILTEAVQDTKSFDTAVESLKEPGEKIGAETLHELLNHGTVQKLIDALSARPQ